MSLPLKLVALALITLACVCPLMQLWGNVICLCAFTCHPFLPLILI